MKQTIIAGSIADLTKEHARLGPSGADGWFECAMFPTMTELYGDNLSSFAAEEGTAAHELLEMCLNTKKRPEYHRGDVLNKSEQFPDGFVVDDEMIDAVEEALSIIEHELLRMMDDDPGTQLFAERRVDPGKLFGRTDCWGTADVTIVNEHEILVIDLKYGRGVYVEIEDKKQTILYLLGAMAELSVEDMMSLRTLKHAILQPRYPDKEGNIYREQQLQVYEMPGWVDSFRITAAATDDEDAAVLPGEEQCRWCDGKGDCEAYANDAVASMFGEPLFDDTTPGKNISVELEGHAMREPNTLSPDQVLAVLDNAAYITAFIKAVQESVKRDLLAGVADPVIQASYKLVRGLGNASWTMSDEEIAKKLKNMKIAKADTVNEKLKSPTQIRKIAKSHLSEQRQKNLEKLIERKERAPSLVPNVDDRVAVETTVQAKFGPPIKQ